MAELTNDLLAAVLAATPDRKSAALRVLRGEVDDGGPAKRVLPEPFVTQRDLSRHVGLSVPTLWRYPPSGRLRLLRLRVDCGPSERLSLKSIGKGTAPLGWSIYAFLLKVSVPYQRWKYL